MCFDLDSRPPIVPIAGGALDSRRLTLTSADGASFAAFQARAANPTGAGIVVLPDIRGLHPYYEELVLRFAEHDVDAIAVDYFGRTAFDEPRDETFESMPHVGQTTWAGLQSDIGAAVALLRSPDGGTARSLFATGFCMGGRLAFLTATLGLDVAGVIGFYGWPTGPARNDTPAPAEMAAAMEGGVLGIFGGADQGIGASVIDEFETALTAAEVDHRLITYPGAPHGFFDRKATEFAEASAAAWQETLGFIQARTAPAD
jgi:carboxymethylenebutenolidase